MDEPDFISAHKHSINHREEILRSEVCGCFFCLEIYKPEDIWKWLDTEAGAGQMALCPRCGIDSVIGSASGYPITVDFLKAMNRHWF